MTELQLQRFWAKVTKTEACWLWSGCLSSGYGRVTMERRSYAAHRISYELAKGPIPLGKELDHLCRVRACVNPAHLEPVTSSENKFRSPLVGRYTNRENQKRGSTHHNGAKTHCARGHPFAGDNLRVDALQRRCRRCSVEYTRLYRQRKLEGRER